MGSGISHEHIKHITCRIYIHICVSFCNFPVLTEHIIWVVHNEEGFIVYSKQLKLYVWHLFHETYYLNWWSTPPELSREMRQTPTDTMNIFGIDCLRHRIDFGKHTIFHTSGNIIGVVLIELTLIYVLFSDWELERFYPHHKATSPIKPLLYVKVVLTFV